MPSPSTNFDAEFVTEDELRSDSTLAYRTGVVVTSTTALTKQVVVSGGLQGLAIPNDVPSEPGDKVLLAGNAAAGLYTIDTIISDTTLVVVENIVDSVGGTAEIRHKAGAVKVGFDPTGTPSTDTNVQDALKYALNNATGITSSVHRTLLQLIHFIDQGPALGFTTGATRSVTGTSLPSQILWRRADNTKLVEKNITYTGAFPTTIEWKLYDTDGTTVLETVTDTITYSGAFETSRTRAIA